MRGKAAHGCSEKSHGNGELEALGEVDKGLLDPNRINTTRIAEQLPTIGEVQFAEFAER